MSYAVKEMFLTLQGEGVQAGRRAVFLRFAGCNLWSGREQDRRDAVCRFCDTDFVGTDGDGGGKFATFPFKMPFRRQSGAAFLGKAVAALGAAHPGQDACPDQGLQNLFKVTLGNALALRDLRRLHRGRAGIVGNVQHRLDGEHQLLGDAEQHERLPVF